MTFFFDTNLSEKIVNGFKEFGEDVVHLKEYFKEDTPDEEWLRMIGANKWILITRDKRIRYNALEISEIRRHKIGVFVLL